MSLSSLLKLLLIRPNKKISEFRVTGLRILGRVDTFFLIISFSRKTIILCILNGISPFKMYKIIFFPESLKKKIKVSPGLGFPKHRSFFYLG